MELTRQSCRLWHLRAGEYSTRTLNAGGTKVNDVANIRTPSVVEFIEADLKNTGFAMSSDRLTGSLLRTLASSKPGRSFLELGTGAGMSTAWLLDGMDAHSTLVTVENDLTVHEIAKRHLGTDGRVEFLLVDGEEFIRSNPNRRFDFIFADTWPGKFYCLDEVLGMLNPGGIYVLDDLSPVDTWPTEHLNKVTRLVRYLETQDDLCITKLSWSTGLIIATKIK